jgi:N-acyl-D-aspartate/D-glutamate deacylase
MTYDQATQVMKQAMRNKLTARVSYLNQDEEFAVSLLDQNDDWSSFPSYSAALDAIDQVGEWA